MSIISEALKKAGDKRRDTVRLREGDLITRGLSSRIEKISSRKTRWSIVSGVGTLFIVGFIVAAFLFNAKFLPSFKEPAETASRAMPKTIDFKERAGPSADLQAKNVIYATTRDEEALTLPLALNGVIGGSGKPLAIIDGRILEQGDFVHGAQLISIRSDRAILLYNDKEITLYIE